MYGKPVMTCFKYQVYLYGSEVITYLKGLSYEIDFENVDENGQILA
jgi:hypothetical protein